MYIRTHPQRGLTRTTHIALLTAALLAAHTPQTAHAIDIIIQLQDEGENPSWDPNGAKLEAIFIAAANIWERLLPDAGDYELDVYYDDLDNGTLGQWSFDFGGDNDIRMDPTPRQSDGDKLNWFVDTTPYIDDEFDFSNASDPTQQGMTLFGDLTTAEANDWFFGNDPPDVLEIGYRGVAIATLPVEGSISGSMGTVDMLSVALHEIGHDLGINSGDFEDGWELEPFHVDGVTNVNIDETNGDGGGHFEIPMSLMNPVTPSNVRVLPSAVDVLGVAWDESFPNVDLQRKHFSSGSNWSTAGNWIGNRVPDLNDDAYLLHGGVVFLNSSNPTDAQRLILGNDSELHTGNHHMRVLNRVTIRGSLFGTKAELVVESGGLFENTSALGDGTFIDGGILELDGGTARISFLTNTLGSITGHGTLEILHNLNNNGSIAAQGGTLDITGSILVEGDKLDLDGDTAGELGFLQATSGNIRIFHPMPEDDSFNGTMNIGAGHSIKLGPWTLGFSGLLNLDGSNSADATLGENSFSPRDHELYGQVLVDGRATINPTSTRFNGNSDVQVPDENDLLKLNSPDTAFAGGSYTGFGTIRQGGDFTIEANTTIDTRVFDWGNATIGNNNHTLIESGARLRIDSDTAGNADNAYRGTMTLDRAELQVNFTEGWTLPSSTRTNPAGTMLIRNFGGGDTPLISGNRLTVDSFIEVVGGNADITAPLTTTPNADIFVHAGGNLRLFGHTILNGGFYNTTPGEIGRITQFANIDVVNNVYMDVATYDWGNGTRINGVTTIYNTNIGIDTLFAVRAASAGTLNNAYHGNFNIFGGQLHTEFNNPWTLPNATGTPILGAPRGAITFNYDFFTFQETTGLITGQKMIVAGDITVLQNPVNPNHAAIYTVTEFQSPAAVELQNNTTLLLANDATFKGGSYTGGGTLIQAADFTIAEDTTFDVASFDWGNSINILDTRQLRINPHAHLTINSPDLGDPDNPFKGTIDLRGKLTVNSAGFWTLPAQSSGQFPLPGGVLEFRNTDTPNPDTPTLAGKDLFAFGTVLITADLAVTENYLALLPGAKLLFEQTSTLRFDNTLEPHNIIINHDTSASTLASNGAGHLNWSLSAAPLLQGDAGGSLTLDLAPGTTVSMASFLPPTLTIAPNATLIVAGTVDPFTATSNPDVHAAIINNSTTSLHIQNPNVGLSTLTGTGHTHIHTGGSLSADSIDQVSLQIDPGGTLQLRAAPTTLTTTAGLTNHGLIDLAGTTTINGPVTHTGDLTAPNLSVTTFTGPVTGPGDFSSNGTIRFENTYTPGPSTQQITFDRSLHFTSTATFIADLGGIDPGTGYDQLNVAARATFAGTLDINLFDSFALEIVPFDTFTILTFGANSGNTTFDTVDFTTPSNIPGLWLDINYNPNDLTLAANALPGDANLDGTVDLTDLTILAINFDTPFEDRRWKKADFNNDGLTDLTDLTILAINFGAMTSNGSVLPGAGIDVTTLAAAIGLSLSQVPEPTTLSTVALTVIPLLLRRRGNPTNAA